MKTWKKVQAVGALWAAVSAVLLAAGIQADAINMAVAGSLGIPAGVALFVVGRIGSWLKS